jgi:CheY-like chemotaxis protein
VVIDSPAAAPTSTFLVVDDDPLIRRVIRRILRGSLVLEAASVQEAEAVLATPERRVDLLLSDVVLPDGDGYELSERARALQPWIRLLFMSGYGPGVLAQYGLPRGTLVAKPFTAEQLRGRVLEELGRPVQPLI